MHKARSVLLIKMNTLYLTGCLGQLGTAIRRSFKDDGWLVYGMDVHDEGPQTNLDGYVKGSVANRTDFVRLFELGSWDKFGHNSCLINNAGVAVFSPSEQRTYEEFRLVTDINLLGPIYGIGEYKKMLDSSKSESSTASIINIASIYGLIAPNSMIYADTPRNSSEIYGATKAGVIQLTKYFAARYGSTGLRVNCIAPGGVLNSDLQGKEFIQRYSSLVPQGRLAYEEEIAKTALFLANPGVEYLTGQTIAVDGGMSAW